MHWKRNKGDLDKVIYVSESLSKDILTLNHDISSSGHEGIERRKAILKGKYYWPGMRRDLEEYILSCAVGTNKINLKSFQASALMKKVHSDF